MIREKLVERCREFVMKRIATATQAIEQAQASAKEETKSSAGDKYETGRAMMQLEVEKNMTQLTEAKKLEQTMDQVKRTIVTDKVQQGSVVYTDTGNFFIAISAGALHVGGESFVAVSAASPIGKAMIGKRVNESFVFNKRSYLVKAIA